MQENSDWALSFGRMDQYLLPYLQRDLRQGRLDLARALELVMCFYIKTNDHTPLIPTVAEPLFGGTATNQAITLGGLASDGRDGTNLLSYLMLRAIDLLKLREPNIDARFHGGSPPLWRRKALQVVRSTRATPALYNDETIIPALKDRGASVEDARDYGVIGCVEPAVQGKSYPATGSNAFNLTSVLELALHDGVHTAVGLDVGPRTGQLEGHAAYDSLWKAFKKQLDAVVDLVVEAETLYEKAHQQLHPVPLLSTLVEGPVEKGCDLTDGGAVYNSSGVWVLGLADVTDSLAALKTLVFEQKRVDARQMREAVEANFEGYQKVRAMCLNRAPKYGNDEPAADDIAVALVQAIDASFARHRNHRGGPYHIGYWTMTFHAGFGMITGALPSGRLAGQPLASGATPVSGAARKGPSASLGSTARLPGRAMLNGIANNHKIPATLLDREGKTGMLDRLVRGFFDKRGMQVQFNIADRDTLLKAMDDPALARDLLVRVSGYTAYFGDLNREMQQEIIDRTEDVF
jgi:formate C-acetyltransferase